MFAVRSAAPGLAVLLLGLTLHAPAAWGQARICTYTIGDWVSDIDGIESVMAASDFREARILIEILDREWECLAEPAPPAQLLRFAQLRALLAFHTSDSEGAARWARAAEFIEPGADYPEWVPEFHPIRDIFEMEDPPEIVTSPGLYIEQPRRGGGVFISGRFATTPTAPLETPILIQVFDRTGERIESFWQESPKLPDRLLTDNARAANASPPKWWVPTSATPAPTPPPVADVVPDPEPEPATPAPATPEPEPLPEPAVVEAPPFTAPPSRHPDDLAAIGPAKIEALARLRGEQRSREDALPGSNAAVTDAWAPVAEALAGGDAEAPEAVAAFLDRHGALAAPEVEVARAWSAIHAFGAAELPSPDQLPKALVLADERLAADAARARHIDAATAPLRKEAQQEWGAAMSIAAANPDAARASVERFVARYGSATLLLNGERIPIAVAEVPDAIAWLDDPKRPKLASRAEREPRTRLPREPMSGGKRTLITSGVGVGVAAGLTYGASWLLRSMYDANPSDGMYHATNSALVGSAVLGTAATGLLVGGILTNAR